MSTPHRALALLCLLVALAYVRSLSFGFAWDDHRIIESSPRMHTWSTAAEVFVQPSYWVIGDASETPVTTYRPLALATMAVDWALWGGAPAGFHATSLALHLGCVAVFFFMLVRLGVSPWAALAGAAIFGVHPCGAEAVTWINGRSEPLCLLFGMAAVGLAAGAGPGSRRRWAGLGACICLSLLGKETGIIFAVLAGLMLFRGADPGAPRPWKGLGAIVGGLAVYFALRSVALSGAPAGGALALGDALRAWPMVWLRTLEVALVPHALGLENLIAWLETTSLAERIVAWMLFAGAALGAPYLLWRGRRLDALGLGWALAAMGPPSLTLATGGYWPGLSRWVYVALPGLLIPACRALGPYLTRGAPRLSQAAGAATAVVLLLAVELQPAIGVWESDEALMIDMAEHYPENEYAYLMLARQRLAHGDANAALAVLGAGRQTARRPEKLVCLEARTLARVGQCDASAASFGAADCRAVAGMKPAEELAACRGGAN